MPNSPQKYLLVACCALSLFLLCGNSLRSEPVQFSLNKVIFSGNYAIKDDDLLPSVQFLLDADVTFQDLEKAVASVDRYYSSNGYLVSVYLPAQDLTSGQLVINVSEATVGSILVQNNGEDVIGGQRLRRTVAQFNNEGSVLNLNNIQQSINILNDLAGVSSDVALQPGPVEKQVDLLVTAKGTPKFTGNFIVDNWGHASTGQRRFASDFHFNNLLSFGEGFSLKNTITDGSTSNEVKVSIPLAYSGSKLQLAALNLKYRLIDEFASLDTSGSSGDNSINFTFPVVTSQALLISGNVKANHSKSDSYSFGNHTSDQVENTLQAALNISAPNLLFENSNSNFGITVTRGKLDLRANVSGELDNDTLETHGYFTKVRMNLGHSWKINQDLQAKVSLEGQAANKNLGGNQSFTLGGAQAVRAYPGSEASGDEGHLVKFELKHLLSNGGILFTFMDVGRIKVDHKPLPADLEGPNVYSLRGYGIGFERNLGEVVTLSATLAGKIGDNSGSVEQPDGSRTENDKSNNSTRVWVGLSWYF